MEYCKYCGKPMNINRDFCIFCGRKKPVFESAHEIFRDIVGRIQRGEQQALDEFYLELQKYVRFQVKTILKNDDIAEDVAQEVSIYVCNNINCIQDPDETLEWIKAVTANKIIYHNGGERPYQLFDDEDELSLYNQEETDSLLIPESAYESKEFRELIHDFVGELPANQRTAIEGYYFEGKGVREIAGETGMSENMVMTSLRRGKNNLWGIINAWSEKTGQKL